MIVDAVRPIQQPTFMEAVQRNLPQPVFTIGLKPNSHGTLNFGYVEKSLYQGDLITAPVDNSRSAWIVNSLTLSAGKASVTQQMLFGTHLSQCLGGSNADWHTDSGSSDTMVADPTFVNNFWSQVSGSSNKTGPWQFPCNSKIPDLQVGVRRTGSHAIAGTTFNAGPVQGTRGKQARVSLPGSFHSELVHVWKAFHLDRRLLTPNTAGTCRGALQAASSIAGVSGLGSVAAPFFLTFFVAFNQAEPSISFAPQVQS